MSASAQPYLFFNSNCREAIEFYQKLGIGRIERIVTNADAPEGMEYDPARKDNIMHASLVVGDSTILASDSPPNWYQKPQGFNIHLSLDNVHEAERLFAALAEAGEVQMPLEEVFWAQRFGACVDHFGIPWMISVDKPV